MDGDRAYQRDIERETRRRIRREMRACERADASPLRGAMLGLIIIAVGVGLLLNNLGLVRFRDIWDFAPLVLVVIGTVRLLDSGGRTSGLVAGAVFIAAGGLWFARNMGWIYLDGRIVFPVFIMGLGALFLVRALDRQRWNSVESGAAPAGADSPPEKTDTGSAGGGFVRANFAVGSVLHEFVMFGGLKRRIVSQQFRGGDMFAMFGGIETDLRGAGMAGVEASIDANAIFGGISLKVPATWHVVVRGQGIFGGYEDKTLLATTPNNVDPPLLIIRGVAMFGGVVVEN